MVNPHFIPCMDNQTRGVCKQKSDNSVKPMRLVIVVAGRLTEVGEGGDKLKGGLESRYVGAGLKSDEKDGATMVGALLVVRTQ